MTNNIGLWIDHKQAIMVILNGQGEQIRRLESGADKHVRFRGGVRMKTPYGAQHFPAEDRKDRQFTEQLNQFYRAVIATLRDAASIFIFGPGEAKSELERRIIQEKAALQVVKIESADKMTERQIAAKVRRYFEK